ncbi:MAG: rRNA maturation RNase YbeY [Candidatus Eremiobacteraeota bacterium]|nr:rRNA maturation RNase YbeY [Candidatus Eremiobacteraeota bacterium]
MSRNRILISNRQRLFHFPPELVRSVINTTLEDAKILDDCEVSIVFCRDSMMKKLNRKYRNIDEPTDVLAFPQFEGKEFLKPGNGVYILLGDVVISTESAMRNAKRYGSSVVTEIARLLIHGTLHLLGWRDDDSGSKKRMQEKVKSLLYREGLDLE